MKKVLVIRFSSIGDIVLTTPVLRALQEQAGVEVHFLTKARYAGLLEVNQRISRVYAFGESLREVLPALRAERYDFLVDLHNNLRSHLLRWHLRRPVRSFPKLNLRKWLLVRFKWNLLPEQHLVERYMSAAEPLGVQYDGLGLEHFIPDGAERFVVHWLEGQGLSANERQAAGLPLIALAIGGTYATKRLPLPKLLALCEGLPGALILLGGEQERETGERIAAAFAGRQVKNLCGKLSLQQSAAVLAKADLVIAHDTGMMHLAAALKRPLISVWGNTVPAFGMYPLYPRALSYCSWRAEVRGLSCRPCSKLGYASCPKKHFHCMNKQDIPAILQAAETLLAQNGHLSLISEKN